LQNKLSQELEEPLEKLYTAYETAVIDAVYSTTKRFEDDMKNLVKEIITTAITSKIMSIASDELRENLIGKGPETARSECSSFPVRLSLGLRALTTFQIPLNRRVNTRDEIALRNTQVLQSTTHADRLSKGQISKANNTKATNKSILDTTLRNGPNDWTQ
jgi:hypothetical protein